MQSDKLMIGRERWLDIPGYEGLYQMSTEMNIRSVKFPGRMKKSSINRVGEEVIVLYKNNTPTMYTIGRLFRATFVDRELNVGRKTGKHRAVKCLEDNREFRTYKECCAYYGLIYKKFCDAAKRRTKTFTYKDKHVEMNFRRIGE